MPIYVYVATASAYMLHGINIKGINYELGYMYACSYT